LLQRLSVFAGGWTLEAAEHVGCGEGIDSCAVLDLLGGLVNKSLVAIEAEGKPERRYRMLETIRQYAHEKLVADGLANEARNQHLQYYTVLAERVGSWILGPNMAAILRQLEVELDNIRLALDWSLEAKDTTSRSLESGLRLMYAFWMFFHFRARHSEAARWLDRLLALEVEERGEGVMSPERMKLRAQALLQAGAMAWIMGKLRKGTEWLEEGRSLFEQLGPNGGLGYAWVLYQLGQVAMVQSDVIQAEKLCKESLLILRELRDLFGVHQNLLELGVNEIARQDYEQARRYFEEDLAVTKEIGYLGGSAAALWGLGATAFLQNDPEKARQLLDESQVIYRQVGDTWALCLFLLDLGQLDWEAGNYPDALRHFDEVLSLGRQQGDVNIISYALSNLGRLALSQGDWDQAENRFSENLAFNRRNDTRDHIALALFDLGNLAFEEDNLEKAANSYTQARDICQEMDSRSGRAATLYGLGRVALARGDYPLAGSYLLESLSLQPYSSVFWYGSLTGPWSAFYTLEALAILVVPQQHYDLAVRLLAVTEAWYTRYEHARTPREREMREHSLAAIRTALGEEAFTVAWAEGKAMTLEQAVGYAKSGSII
jgi:tetratricopeptide (TPR) repeat protein